MSAASIIILGMHRSGTSCLAGSLEQAGLFLGEVNRKAPYNAKGNHEYRDIMDLNDAVLSDNGAAWDRPPGTAIRWSQAHREQRDRLLANYPDDRPYGFKDPRTLLTLDGWLEALPDARFVGSFRHPHAVAQSLQARDGFALQQGLDLWRNYNRRLLDLCVTRDMPLICFDWPPARYGAALMTVCDRLNLTPPPGGFDFFETGLRRRTAREELPKGPRIREIYQALLALATSPAAL